MDDNTVHQHASKQNALTPEEYGRKRAEIQAAKAFLERIEIENETGRKKYEAELLQKVQEGEEARRRLLEMERYHHSLTNGPLAIEAAPSTARIEELPGTSPQLHNAQWPTGSAPGRPSLKHPSHFPPPTQSTILPPAQSTTLPPAYQGLLQQLPHREPTHVHSGGPSRDARVPPPQNSVVAHASVRGQQELRPIYYRPPNQQVQQPAFQQRKPSMTHRTESSSTRIPLQSQAQTVSVNSSSGQTRVNGPGGTRNDVPSPVHYKPTGVQSVGTSSLIGALGPQTSESMQPNAPPSSTVVPESVPNGPQVPQIPTSGSVPQSSEIRSSVTLLASELEDRKLKILALRSFVLEWAKNSRPNTRTEMYRFKVLKAPNSALYITSLYDGREITEEQHDFFQRLWVTSGLYPDNIPFKKQGSTSAPSTSKTTIAGPLTVPHTKPNATESVSAEKGPGNHSGSSSAASHSGISPFTPRRTLVDPVSGASRSPADADKKRLARDVIHALGKRKQDVISPSSVNESRAKRQALETPSASGGVHRISEPVQTSTTPSITLPTLQLIGQSSEQVVRHEVTSKPVTVTMASTEIQQVSRQPSAEPFDPPRTTAPSETPHSQSEPRTLQGDIADPCPKERQSSSVPSQPNGDAQGSQGQVAPRMGRSPSERTTTIPSQALPSPLPPVPRAIVSTFLQQDPRKSGPAESATQSPIAAQNTAIARHGVIVPPSITQGHQADTQPSSLIKMEVDRASDNTSSQVKPHPPSNTRVAGSEQDIPSSSNNEPFGNEKPSGNDFSQEGSTSNLREPLFLPSPSSSPLPSKQSKRSSSVYVLVPPAPEYLIRYRKRQSMKDELDSQIDSAQTSSFSASRASRSLEDFSLRLESDRDIDPFEQEAVQLSCSRLQPLPCRWGECDITLSSVDTLIQHLNWEHKPAAISFICRWTQCGRQCRSHEKHLERHATMTLQCAYRGCKESYRSSGQLLKHFRAKHANGMLKVQAKPFRPKARPPVPLPEIRLPSFLINTPVMPTSITPDHHSVLEPWVLRRIVEFDGDRPKRAKKSNDTGSTAEASNSYEFLNMRSTRYSWIRSKPVNMEFDDLDSEEISKECDEGLTFFDSGAEESGVEDLPPSDEETSLSPNFSSPTKSNDIEGRRLGSSTEPSSEDMVQKLLID